MPQFAEKKQIAAYFFVFSEKISKMRNFFEKIFLKALVILTLLPYNCIISGAKWCKVVSFPHFPHGFPH